MTRRELEYQLASVIAIFATSLAAVVLVAIAAYIGK